MEMVKARTSPSEGSRMGFVDNLRWMVIVMVVVVHANVTYSGMGSWFYKEPHALDAVSTLVFMFYESFSQAFFMGILFFLAGTFVPSAYDRKGFGRFVADRMVRLGAPTLVFMLVLDPLTRLIMDLFARRSFTVQGLASGYAATIRSGEFLARTGPLWFALALLVFSVVYALARLVVSSVVARRAPGSPGVMTPRAIHGAALGIIVIIALGSFLVRIVQPIGTAWYNMQLCFFTQYVVLFLAGLWAGRNGFLRSLPASVGAVWLRLAFAVGVPVWFLLLGLGDALHSYESSFTGGWHWQAAGYALWEAFFCVSVSLGLITLFRKRVNAPTAVRGFLSRTSFGVYTFHAPVLVTVSLLIQAWAVSPLAKAALAAGIAFAASLAVAAAVRGIPGLRRIFS